MKSDKIFLISFTKRIEIGDDYSHPLYTDMTNCLSEGDDKYIGFADNEDIFVRLSEAKVKDICNVFEKYGFEFDVNDVTSELIKGEIHKKYPEVESLTPGLFENFRLDETSINDILDKISEKGIDSLDEVDKRILNA